MRAMRLPPGYFPRNPREDPLYIEHPTRGYTLRPGAHHEYVTPEVHVAIDISADGLRDTALAVARNADYRVLSIGDSFTMGLAVASQDTWSAQFERLLAAGEPRRAVRVVNAGVPGYSARQIRLRLEELFPIIRPNLVVYGLTTETYTRMLRPIVLYGGTLVRSDALPGLRITEHGLLYSPYRRAWLREVDYWLNEHLQLGAHVLSRARLIYEMMNRRPGDSGDAAAAADPERIRRDMKPALEELAATHREVVAQGVLFIVLMINMQQADGTFRPQDAIYNRIVAGECRRDGMTCIDLLPELARRASGRPIFRTPHDQHWTPGAHALAARALLQTLRQMQAAHGAQADAR